MIKPIVSIISLFVIGLILMQCSIRNKDETSMLLYVGTYTETDSQGIELYKFHSDSGHMEFIKTFSHIPNPSYLYLAQNGRTLFAVNELVGSREKPEGAISAFSVNPDNGDLKFINSISSEGRAPCYLSLSASNRFLLVNNYLDGKAMSVNLLGSGALGEPVSILHFVGSGPVKGRQDASHVHSINPDPQNRFVVTADLGTDKLSVFRLNASDGTLSEVEAAAAQTAPGAGPRHTAFTADGRTVFVANELNSTVEAFRFNSQTGSLVHLQTIRTLPGKYTGKNYPADIHLSPDNRYLYVSNRGHESIAIFSLDKLTAELSFVATQSVFGSWPRNFVLSKDGNWLLVANQKSRNIVVFRRNQTNGLLIKRAGIKSVAAPVCLVLKN